MNFNDFKNKWLSFIASLNSKGIPLPLVRDPKTGRGDVALTLVFLSSLLVQVGLIGKWSKYLGEIDVSSALNWFYGCSALYWARKMSGKNDLGDSIQPSSAPVSPTSSDVNK